MLIKSFLAFGAGFISFLTPCVLPIIPGYISYITGKKLDEIDKDKKIVLIKTIIFTLGFSFVFISLGMAASFLGNVLIFFGKELRIAAGIIIILFSLNFIGILNFNFLNQDKKIDTGNYKDNFVFPFVVGSAFAFGWTPCIGPILGSVLSIAASSETVTYGIVLLMLYSAGLGIPFLLAAYAINGFMRFLSKIRNYIRAIEIFTGVLLVIFGILILTNRIQELAFFFIKYFPFLTQFG